MGLLIGHGRAADGPAIGCDTPAVASVAVTLHLTVCPIGVADRNEHLWEELLSLLLSVLLLCHTPGRVFAGSSADLQLGVTALCTKELAAGHEGSSVRGTEGLPRNIGAVHVTLSVLVHTQERERRKLLSTTCVEDAQQDQERRNTHLDGHSHREGP